MHFNNERYFLLPSEGTSSPLSEAFGDEQILHPSKDQKRLRMHILLVALTISLTVNVIAATHALNVGGHGASEQPTKYAGLSRNMLKPFKPGSLYEEGNESLADAYWDSINLDAGIISVPQDWATRKALPKAQVFPWDSTRSIYLLNGYHNVHCLKTLRRSLVEHRRGARQSYPTEHVEHCLAHLLDDALCTADDTPTKEHGTPLIQYRQCRDWSALEAWAKLHNACYKLVNETDAIPTLDRYRFCPENSPYLAEVKKWYPDAVPYH